MIGILLINLGTPDASSEEAVKQYLTVFLSDPYVITLPTWLRHFLVQKIILPRRPKLSAHAYQQIWTPEGSPLLVNSVKLQKALQKKLGESYCVVQGMRYGNPSIDNAVTVLQKNQCDKIMILPLFPQFANATTQSALEAVNGVIKNKKINAKIHIIRDFYNQNFYIQSIANSIQASLEKNPTDFLLLSYHGLPARQHGANEYRAHCCETSDLITKTLKLPENKYQTAFQSRLGFVRWISPYTDHVIKQLRKNGIKKLSVVCPSFIVDCVETLEEINIRLRAQWMQQLRGESFELISCLNANDHWVNVLGDWICKQVNCAEVVSNSMVR